MKKRKNAALKSRQSMVKNIKLEEPSVLTDVRMTPTELGLTRPEDRMPSITARSNNNSSVGLLETNTVDGSRKANLVRKRRLNSPRVKLEPLEIVANKSSIVQQDNGRVLMSFFQHFLSEDGTKFSDDIDLTQHGINCGMTITDTTLHEVAGLIPYMRVIRISNCDEITDNGICNLGIQCHALQEMYMNGCTQVSVVGLRQIVHLCKSLEVLDLSDCPQMNDQTLIALASCVQIKKLVFQRCKHISDNGIAQLSRCCKRLTYLDISSCAKIGEYGDLALLQIGKNCQALKVLDLYGCQHVRDKGVRAIARGCPLLNTLRLTGCNDVSEQAIRLLAKYCNGLQVLSLAGCTATCDDSLVRLAKSCAQLKWLDISGSPKVGVLGIRELFKQCTRLEYLDISKCKNVNDEVLQAISNYASMRFASLYLSHCNQITEHGVQHLVNHCRKLFTLDISCKSIGRRFLQQIVNQIPYVEWANAYFGLKPRDDAQELWHMHRLDELKAKSVTNIQKIYRGVKARGGVYAAKRKAVERNILPKIQAHVRGCLARSYLRRLAFIEKQTDMAIVIQKNYRKYCRTVEQERLRRVALMIERDNKSAIVFQKRFRGYRSRKIVQAMRDEIARLEQLEARREAMLELAAIALQQAFRGHRGRADAGLMRALREKEKQDARKARLSAIDIQRVYRGHCGRQTRRHIVEHKRILALRQLATTYFQAIFRGFKGRKRAAIERKEAIKLRRFKAATKLQRFWKGSKARHFGSLMLSLVRLRQHEQLCALNIQRVYRGYMARDMVQALRKRNKERVIHENAVIKMQRVFRGHKGRETFEIKKAMRKVEIEAHALRSKLQTYEREHEECKARLEENEVKFEHDSQDAKLLEIEVAKASQVKAKHHDSDRITGVSQRFPTKFLQLQLAEQLRVKRLQLAEDKAKVEAFVEELEVVNKKCRQIRRQLLPLTDAVVVHTKAERTDRLRSKAREEKVAALKIQSVFRGFRTRCAATCGANYWVELFDEKTKNSYFYNSWTQETRWSKPLGMGIFQDAIVSRPKQDTSKWTKLYDPETRLNYYIHNDTAECRWEEPILNESKSTWLQEQNIEELTARSQSKRNIGEWEEMHDESSGQVYYFNKRTNESRWSLTPRDANASAAQVLSGRRSARSIESGSRSERWQRLYGYSYDDQGQLIKEDENRTHWTIEVDETSGNEYYYNHVTCEYRWEKPDDFEASNIFNSSRSWFEIQNKVSLSARSKVSKQIGEWTEMQDPSTENTYYYNESTGESVWSLPPEIAYPPKEEEIINYDIPKNIRDHLDRLHSTSIEYTDRAQHLEWLDASINAKEWVKAECIIEQITVNENAAKHITEDEEKNAQLAAQQHIQESFAFDKKPQDPQSWITMQDENGTTYYYNEQTGETQWEPPPTFIHRNASRMNGQSICNGDISTAFSMLDVSGTGSISTDQLSSLFTTLDIQLTDTHLSHCTKLAYENNDQITLQQFTQYWNNSSEETPSWLELQDENGNTYYYNQESGITQWEKPFDFIS